MNVKAPAQKSVKTVLFVALSLLAALFVGSIVWKGLTTLAVYRSALVQQDFDQGANRFIKGLFEVLMERLARVSERMCKQVSVSLPYRGDSHDEQPNDYTGITGSTAC